MFEGFLVSEGCYMKNRAWKPVRGEAKVGFRVAGPGFRVRVYRGLGFGV